MEIQFKPCGLYYIEFFFSLKKKKIIELLAGGQGLVYTWVTDDFILEKKLSQIKLLA